MKQIKKKWRMLLILLVCISTLSFAAYAAYNFNTSGNFKRVAVARTRDVTDSLRFSSNYLSPYAADAEIGTYPVSVSNDSDVTIGITVCNYPQDAQSDAWANEQDITYTISMKVLDSEFNEKIESSVTIDPSGTHTLKGGSKSVQLHKITIPKALVEEIGKGYIQVTAQPDGSSMAATNRNILAANLQIIPASTKATAWAGVSGDNGIAFSLLDAYNYQISGTEQAVLTLSWNKEKVTLSDWSIKTLKPVVTAQEITDIKSSGEITFSVGGQDQPTSYMLQFYKAGNGPADFKEMGISLTTQN